MLATLYLLKVEVCILKCTRFKSTTIHLGTLKKDFGEVAVFIYLSHVDDVYNLVISSEVVETCPDVCL